MAVRRRHRFALSPTSSRTIHGGRKLLRNNRGKKPRPRPKRKSMPRSRRVHGLGCDEAEGAEGAFAQSSLESDLARASSSAGRNFSKKAGTSRNRGSGMFWRWAPRKRELANTRRALG